MKCVEWKLALLLTMAILSVGCSTDPSDELGQTPPNEGTFRFEVLQTSKTSVAFRITPTDPERTYVMMITEQENFEQYGSDAACVEDDLKWFEAQATNEGISLEEYLIRTLRKGVLEGKEEGLMPQTNYYIYAYGLDVEGFPTSQLEKIAFHTEDYTLTDATFEVQVTERDYRTATIAVVPSEKRAPYFVNCISESDYAFWGGDEQAYFNHLLSLRDYYLAKGATTEQMIANLCFVGDDALPVEGLIPGTTYYAYAIGVDEEFFANSRPEVITFQTRSVEESDLTLAIEIGTCYYDHVEGAVIPSNDEEPYILSIQPAASLEEYDSDEAYIYTLLGDLEYWYGSVEQNLFTGQRDLSSFTLYPETEYVVVCFGYDAAEQVPTTRLFSSEKFQTAKAEGESSELEVSLVASELTHNSVTITATPSLGAYYFFYYTEKSRFDEKVVALGSTDAAIQALANAEIDFGADYFGYTRSQYLREIGATIGTFTEKFYPLNPATTYVAYAIAVDLESGELASERGFVSEPFTTLAKIISDATVTFALGDYYDGTALAELDPERFSTCRGYVLQPYTITPSSSATDWYTNYWGEDCSEFTDDQIYEVLITWGYEFDPTNVSVNSLGGYAVLSYDYAFSFVGLAKDANGNYGPGSVTVVTPTRDGVSPAEELIARLEQEAKRR